MRIFISGASGLVGSNCLSWFIKQGADAIGSYFSYQTSNTVFFDTLHLDNSNNFNLNEFQPQIIVHCGALTHVDYCEDHVEESYEKTVVSTRNLLQLAEKYQAKLVYLSTDYVFDGEQGPYVETDAVNPLSIYAKHKLEAEREVMLHHPDHLVLRITNVYGHEARNKNFVSRIIEQCQNNQALTLKLPKDQYATPVNALDVAKAMWLLLHDNRSGVFHIASTDFMNRVELAMTVLRHFPTAQYTLEVLTTDEMKQPAKRPLRGGLVKSRFSDLYPEFIFSTVDSFVREFI
ncbi:MAG: SDR family oxidoreductase [Chitinophagaceae bacterium]|nr:SDR family oxidoreductase [Chitinophagaceae bacterium]